MLTSLSLGGAASRVGFVDGLRIPICVYSIGKSSRVCVNNSHLVKTRVPRTDTLSFSTALCLGRRPQKGSVESAEVSQGAKVCCEAGNGHAWRA